MACLWLPSSFFPIWYFFYHLGKVLDNFSTKYDRFVLLGDFNGQESETILSEFLNACNAKYIVKKTCFKSIENPSCIDLIITDKSGTFQHTNVLKQVYQITINLLQQLWKQNLQWLHPIMFITMITKIRIEG